MVSRRLLKVAQAIREVVSTAIVVDLQDPRIKNATVTYVEVSGDLVSSWATLGTVFTINYNCSRRNP